MRALLANDADVNTKSTDGVWTALMLASWNGRTVVVKALLDAGASVDMAEDEGNTALDMAQYGRYAVIVDILEATEGLLNAATFGNSTLAKMYIDKGASLNATDTDGQTALMQASRFGHDDIVAALLEAGANVNRRDKEGHTALWWARRLGKVDVVEKLLAVDGIVVDPVDKAHAVANADRARQGRIRKWMPGT